MLYSLPLVPKGEVLPVSEGPPGELPSSPVFPGSSRGLRTKKAWTQAPVPLLPLFNLSESLRPAMYGFLFSTGENSSLPRVALRARMESSSLELRGCRALVCKLPCKGSLPRQGL